MQHRFQQLASTVLPLHYLRENNTQENSINIAKNKLLSLSQIYADETQNNKTAKTATTTPICLSLRNNAACCIRLRYLRYLRENKHIRELYQSVNMLNNLSEPHIQPILIQPSSRALTQGFSKKPVAKCLHTEYRNVASPIFIIQVSPLCRLSQCHIARASFLQYSCRS